MKDHGRQRWRREWRQPQEQSGNEEVFGSLDESGVIDLFSIEKVPYSEEQDDRAQLSYDQVAQSSLLDNPKNSHLATMPMENFIGHIMGL